MNYKLSNDDKANCKWFENDHTRQSLRSIELVQGSLRGLYPFKIELNFPITAIAGSNGSGKSTLLALAACAYHNSKSGYKRADRRNSYYTFSDFFVQSNSELPPQGVKIRYGISHNKWSFGEPRVAYQVRKKKTGGKWNNYDKRVSRNVDYFGLARVVPHYERSAHKSYRSRFTAKGLDQSVRNKIALIAGRIIGKKYDSFESHGHSKYSLPKVSSNELGYSGFNMGAGESAVFEILTTLFTIGTGALLVIDEIELGLHEKAQFRLIEELKKICLELKCQIICSTHSFAILSSLPPEARVFIEPAEKSTQLIKGISPEYACGKMGAKNSQELDVFVEDHIAEKVVSEWIPVNARKRINLCPIGSHVAVVKILATRYLEGKDNCICLLDGDQRSSNNTAIKQFVGHTEASNELAKENAKAWLDERLHYLPGDVPPEKWLANTLQTKVIKNEQGIVGDLMDKWGLEDTQPLFDSLTAAVQSETHSEFHFLAEEVSVDPQIITTDVIRSVKRLCPEYKEQISDTIIQFLDP